LSAADFYVGKHRTIFAAAAEVYEKTKGLDLAVLREHLAAAGRLEDVGGVEYLNELAGGAGTAAGVEHLARLVKDKSLCRQLVAAGVELVRDAFEPGRTAPELAAAFSARLTAIDEAIAGGSKATSIAAALKELFASLDGKISRAFSTGIPCLDKMAGGIMPGELCVLLAKRGSGKSTLGAQLLLSMARGGVPGMIASYEMSTAQFLACAFAATAQRVFPKDWPADEALKATAQQAADVLAPLPIFIDDNPTRRLSALLAACRQRARKDGCRAFMVDYVQLVPADEALDSREQEVARTSRALKLLARELSAVVVACAQINDRGLSRESRAIENDADMLIHIEAPDPETSGPVVQAQLIIKKNRSGACGTVNTRWDKGYRTFSDWIPPVEERAADA
jgi:replicative DNA helicase